MQKLPGDHQDDIIFLITPGIPTYNFLLRGGSNNSPSLRGISAKFLRCWGTCRSGGKEGRSVCNTWDESRVGKGVGVCFVFLWKKSCTSSNGKYTITYKVSYISGGAGFQPTVPKLGEGGYFKLQPSQAVSFQKLFSKGFFLVFFFRVSRIGGFLVDSKMEVWYKKHLLRYQPSSPLHPTMRIRRKGKLFQSSHHGHHARKIWTNLVFKPPNPLRVTIRVTFRSRPYEPSLSTVTGWGVELKQTFIFLKEPRIYLLLHLGDYPSNPF